MVRWLLSKDLQVHIRDVRKTFMLRVHAPAQITQDIIDKKIAPKDDLGSLDGQSTYTPKEPPHFSIVFIVLTVGVTLILLCLLLFGVAWKQGIPEGDILRFRFRHLVLLVVYFTFNFVYAICVTMTVFVLIIIATNGIKSTPNQHVVSSSIQAKRVAR